MIYYSSNTIIFVDYVVTEGDIIVYGDEEVNDYDILEDVISKRDALWHDAFDADLGIVKIPYLIDDNVDSQTRMKINGAVKEFDEKTCIR